MLVENKVVNLIEVNTGFQCYLDIVPNSVTLPATALTSIDYDSLVNRALAGNKMGNTSEHRISLICNTMGELADLVNQIELLDNTESDDFQKIRVDFSSREPRQEGSNVVRAFYNLTVINK